VNQLLLTCRHSGGRQNAYSDRKAPPYSVYNCQYRADRRAIHTCVSSTLHRLMSPSYVPYLSICLSIYMYIYTVGTRIIRTVAVRPSTLPVKDRFSSGHKSAEKHRSNLKKNTCVGIKVNFATFFFLNRSSTLAGEALYIIIRTDWSP
jgi:hypothetical protein